MSDACDTPPAQPRPCSRCGQEPSLPYHRFGRRCLNAYQRAWRKLQAEMRRQLEADLIAASYGKEISRETVERLEKRSRDDE